VQVGDVTISDVANRLKVDRDALLQANPQIKDLHQKLEPWLLEAELIGQLCLPLNFLGNQRHPFRLSLKEIRARARANANELPVLPR